MANAYTGTTHLFSTPYLTLDEFKNAPTSIDLSNLVFSSQDPDVQDSELTNTIARASSWIDTYCNQVLAATTETEQQRTRISPDGTIRLHPRYSPIIALTAFQYGNPSTQMQTLPDCSYAWIEDAEILVPYANLSLTYSSQGALQFGFPTSPRVETFVKYTYIAGYANTTIVTANAGDTSLTVADGTGITAGLQLKIYDGYNSEFVTVDSSYTFGSTTIPLTSALVNTHATGISISALPPAIKEAAILVTTAFLKVRGDNSMVMSISSAPNASNKAGEDLSGDLKIAQELLNPYKRIR
jgi:CRISPR/Cas system CMR-associated protein Cmr5 small subunit